LADLDKLEHCLEELRLRDRIAEIERQHEATACAFRRLPVVEDWLREASRPALRRKRFLVLQGDSGVGKSCYARSLLGASRTLELNCAGCRWPDLRGFRPELHRAVLFDEASPEMVCAQRKLFQCPPVLIDLGHSPTGQSGYRVWLNDAVLIVCSNGWREALAALPEESDRQWIEANQVFVMIHHRLFVPGTGGSASAAGSG